MFYKKECIAMLLAGGQGSRLYVLTLSLIHIWILQSVQQLYGHGETPTLLIGKDLEVLWANDAASKHPSILTQYDGLHSMLADVDFNKLKQALFSGKEIFFSEGELSFLQAKVELIPLKNKEENFVGAVMRLSLIHI